MHFEKWLLSLYLSVGAGMGIDKLQGKVLFPSKIVCYTVIHTSLLSGDAGRVFLCAYRALSMAYPYALIKVLEDEFQFFLTTGGLTAHLQHDFVHFTGDFSFSYCVGRFLCA